MNIELLKSAITEKFGSQESFATAIGVSRRTLLNWFSSSSIPSDKVFSILSSLDLDETREDALLARPKLEMVFRAKYKKPTSEENKKKFRELADIFMKLNGNAYTLNEAFPRLASPFNFKTVVSTLRSLLSLKDSEPAKLFDVLERLKEVNVNVIFFPFNKLNLELEENTKEVAFTAFKEEKILIFLDTNRTFDQSLFDLLHELTHIICNHVPDTTTKEDETFCNSVAQELIYPEMFFLKNERVTSFFVNFSKFQIGPLKEIIRILAKDFDWSPMGIALSLCAQKRITRAGYQFRTLMVIHQQLRDSSKTIAELFFENFDTTNVDKFIEFFSLDIYKSKDIYKGFIELKNGATFGYLSPSKMSELLNVNSGDMDEIVGIWKKEDSIILGQEAEQNDSQSK